MLFRSVGGVGWARDPQKTQKGLRREPKPLVFPCCGGGFEPPSFGRPRCLSGRYLDIPLMCTEDGDTRAGSLISLLARFYNQRGTAEQWIKEGGSHPLDLAILSSVPGQRGPPPTRGHRLQRRQSVASARPARRHPGLVPHESPAAPVQDWWTPHPTWPVVPSTYRNASMWGDRMAPEGMDVVTSRRERAALDGTWAGLGYVLRTA